MKKHLKLFKLSIAVIMTAVGCMAMTSCDPDEVDAFAKGYRDGYYGYSSYTEMPDSDTGKTVATDTNAE